MPSLGNIIGQASRGADLYFVFRFLRLLTMKYTSTNAYKLGIIDKKGKALKKSADLETIKEKSSYTMLHRMVFKIRALIEKVPGGRFLSYAAALFLLKEQKDVRIWSDDGYMKSKLLEFLETDWEADAKFLKEEVDNMNKKSFKSFISENKTIEESQELQAMMALDDAGIDAVINKKGQVVIKKKDLKKAKAAFKKSFRKGGAPELQTEAMNPKDHVQEKDGKFHVISPKGKVVYSSDDKKEAEEWAVKNHDALMKEGIDIEKADMKDVIKDFQSSDAPQFKGKSDKKKKEMAIAAKLSKEEVEIEEASKSDIQSFGKKLSDYAKKSGGIDKDDFKFIAKEATGGNLPNPTSLSRMDTEPREVVLDLMAKEFGRKFVEKEYKTRFTNPKNYKEGVVIESTKEYAKSLEKIAGDRQLKILTKSERENLLKIAKLLAKEKNEALEKEGAAEFMAAASAAKKEGKKKFKFGGKEYPVTIKVDIPLANEEIANSVGGGGIAGLDTGLTAKKKKDDTDKAKKLRKQYLKGAGITEEVQRTTFAGKDVFIVDSDTFHSCRLGKKKYGRYETYVGNGLVGQTIREYGLKYPRRPIILQNGDSGPMLYLKYGRS
jgi:hypothetical protein